MEELLGIDNGSRRSKRGPRSQLERQQLERRRITARKATKSNGRPAGKVREVFDRVSKLPRRQQEHIVNWVSAYVSHYEHNRQS
jgi:hypothetical protein